MTAKEFLLAYGFSEENAEFLVKYSGIKSVALLEKKLNYLSSRFNLSKKDITKSKFGISTALSCDLATSEGQAEVEAKIEFYSRLLDITNQEATKIIAKNLELLGSDINSMSPTSIKRKVKFYRTLFNVEDKRLQGILKKYPPLLTLDIKGKTPTSVQQKIIDISGVLGITEEEFIKILISAPSVIGYDPTTIARKKKDYKDLLNLTDDEFKNLIITRPGALEYDVSTTKSTSLAKKLEIYKGALNLTGEELKELIFSNKGLLGASIDETKPTGFQSKMATILEYVPKEALIENPMLLTRAPERLKIKYMMLSKYDKEVFRSNTTMVSEQTLYSRIKFLERNGFKVHLSSLGRGEKEFKERYCKTAQIDYQEDILDQNAIKEIESEYNKTADKKLFLTEAEIKATLKATKKIIEKQTDQME